MKTQSKHGALPHKFCNKYDVVALLSGKGKRGGRGLQKRLRNKLQTSGIIICLELGISCVECGLISDFGFWVKEDSLVRMNVCHIIFKYRGVK